MYKEESRWCRKMRTDSVERGGPIDVECMSKIKLQNKIA